MSDNKRYYYLKLKDNFYESEEMIILQNMPDGYLYSDILMKLYLRSLKDNGKLMFNNRIPYNPPILAQIVRHSVGVVEKALSLFKELGLIEILDNGAIYMLDIENFIGKSSTEADRKRLYRSKIEEEKKLLSGGTNVRQTSDKNPPEKEREIELEIELEKEIEIEYREEETTGSGSGEINNIQVFKHFEKCGFGILSPILMEKIKADIEIYGAEWVMKAVEVAAEKGKLRYDYFKAILNNWKTNGFDYKKNDEKNKKTPSYSKNKKSNFADYSGQRTYDFKDLEKKLLGWDK